MIKNVLKETPYFENKVFKKLSNKEVVNDLSKVVKNGDKTLNRAKYQLIVPTQKKKEKHDKNCKGPEISRHDKDTDA